MTKNLALKIVLLISLFSLVINVGSYGVVESSDARYAEIAREMFSSGDYVHPDLLDVHHYHKPPLTYQITAIGYHLFGVNPFGARIFLQLFIVIQLLLIYLIAQLLFENKKTSLWAVIIYFSFPIVLISSRNLTTDGFLTTFILLSIYAWIKYRKKGIVHHLYLFALSLGLGFLVKGPVVFLVPVIFALTYNRYEDAKKNLGIHHFLAVLLFFIIGSSWFIMVYIENPSFVDYFIERQTVDRFSKNSFNRTEPFWYFIALVPLVGLPWLLIFPYLLSIYRKLFIRKSIYLSLLLAIVIPLLFFSLSSSKRLLYVLPIYSLIAILIAQLMSMLTDEITKRISKVLLGFAFIVMLILIISQFINIDWKFPLSIGLIASVAVVICLIVLYKLKNISYKEKTIYVSLVVSSLLLIGGSIFLSVNELKINSPKPVTDFIINHQLKDRNIIIYNTRKPSIAFGLEKSIISLDDGDRGLNRETQFEQDLIWKEYLIDMNNQDDTNRLKIKMLMPSVLIIYKHGVPKTRKWLLDYFSNKEEMHNWTIYY